jgi:hypothetical protein
MGDTSASIYSWPDNFISASPIQSTRRSLPVKACAIIVNSNSVSERRATQITGVAPKRAQGRQFATYPI